MAAAIGIVATALIAAWFVWQPLHSSDEVSSAIDALSRGDAPAALAAARERRLGRPGVGRLRCGSSRRSTPAMGDPVASRAESVKATQIQPSNAETWQQLGAFDLQAHRAQLALAELEVAQRLDRTSPLTPS